MNITESESVVLAEVSEPAVWSLRIHWLSVPFYKQSVVINPLRTYSLCFTKLFYSEVLEQVHYKLWEFYRSLGAFGLCCVCVNSLCFGILGCSFHSYNIVGEVNILPFQTEHFASSESAVHSKHNIQPVLQRFSFESLENLLYFLYGVNFFFLGFTFGNSYTSARVIAEHIHVNSITEYIRDKIQMMHNCFSRQRFTVTLILTVAVEVGDEALYMSCCDFIKFHMTKCRIYSLCGLSHSFVGGRAEVNACILLKPLFSEVLELD